MNSLTESLFFDGLLRWHEGAHFIPAPLEQHFKCEENKIKTRLITINIIIVIDDLLLDYGT